jgi:hypothetical protein
MDNVRDCDSYICNTFFSPYSKRICYLNIFVLLQFYLVSIMTSWKRSVKSMASFYMRHKVLLNYKIETQFTQIISTRYKDLTEL